MKFSNKFFPEITGNDDDDDDNMYTEIEIENCWRL